MAKVVKRKIKVKWKNLIIFLLIIITTFFIAYKGTTLLITTIINRLNKKTEQKQKKKETSKKETNKVEPNKEKTELEKKYDKLNNINNKITYFNDAFIDRYIEYRENNPNMDIEKVIINVNIGLDKEVYTDAVKAINLNKNNILVNKYNYLDENYVPENLEKINTTYALSNMKLVSDAKEAYEEMAKDAAKEKRKLVVMSS